MKRTKEKEKAFLKLIGQNITRIRKKKGWTSKELGLRCDPPMDKSNIIPIEKGRINVTATTLLKIAEALDVNVQDFFK